MRRIETLSHLDMAFVQYLEKVLGDEGIECVVRNGNVAVAGLSERTAYDLSPELWVVDDARFDEATKIVEALG